MQRIILHLDMNSYFASVEQQANPFLRGCPVGICAYLSKNGCLLATSIEAKKYGVKTGLRVPDALKLCPKLVLLENDPRKYLSVSRRVFRIMEEYASAMEIYSIDEAFMDLTGLVADFNKAKDLALTIQTRIKTEVGSWLKCSVGISYTKFLAKFCSDIAESDSIKIIANDSDLVASLKGRLIKEAWGIGPALSQRLNNLGIATLLDLKNYPLQNLTSVLGKQGYYLWADVNGLEITRLSTSQAEPKSIGHSYCLPKPTKDKAILSSLLLKLLSRACVTLRSKNQMCHGLSVFWSYSNGNSFSKQITFGQALNSTEEIFTRANSILNKEIISSNVRMLMVGVFKLVDKVDQLSLFSDLLKPSVVSKVMDNINSRFGSEVLIYGGMMSVKKAAPYRIGFRKVDF